MAMALLALFVTGLLYLSVYLLRKLSGQSYEAVPTSDFTANEEDYDPEGVLGD